MLQGMSSSQPNAIVERLFRHLGWANAHVLASLATLTDEQLGCASPGSDWSAAAIAQHLVHVSGLYASRLDGAAAPAATALPTNSAQIADLAQRCAEYDARLLVESGQPEGIVEYVREGKHMRRTRSALLAQALLHANEHRAQIAGALDAHGVRAIDLDALSPWQFGIVEGLDE